MTYTDGEGKHIVLIRVRKLRLFSPGYVVSSCDIKIKFKKNDILIKNEGQKMAHIRWTKILVELHYVIKQVSSATHVYRAKIEKK